jgi:M6 family metalloprotease-like protein
MSCRVFLRAASCGVLLSLATSAYAVTPPRDGGPLPEAMRRVAKEDATAFTAKRSWVQKAHRIRDARRDYVIHNGPDALSAAAAGQFAVTGTMRIPVLPGYFSNQAGGPVPQLDLQNQLFDSNPTGTVSQYYSEVSYGQFTMDGDVFDWKKLSQLNGYYAGVYSQGTEPGDAHTGELIKELLQANDGGIDFGQYDNDGPDGVPNSGDDDGFVDLLCVLHSFRGGECGISTNIASHTWSYSVWPASGGLPYTTNDAAAGGGFIKVDDYTIAPALSCNTPANEIIEIGVFCHEFGHGLGLPDLYDRLGTSYGIGDWGLMGSGPWNTPDKPAHPEAWTRVEMGWTLPVDIGWAPTPVSVSNAEQNAVAYRLPFTNERFRRSNECVIAGSYSLYCGLTAAEAAARNYPSIGPGYGSNWYQTIERDFDYSGAGAVSFQYKYHYDLEPGYDFGYAIIEVGGVETTLASYTGPGSGTANIALTPYLAPLAGAGGTYTLKFRVITDLSFDNGDGNDPSVCGALSVDDVSVTGGGESYASGFETYADGWHQDPAENPSSEYWLVENRRRIGSDINLHAEGLLIWHVDEEIMHNPFMANDGKNGAVRGLVLEEGDGLGNLLLSPLNPNSNPGDAGDTFPGSTNNTLFGSLTTPASTDNTQRATRIEVSGIGAAAPAMSATLRAGDRGPLATGIAPAAIDNDQVAAQIEIAGSRFKAGATFTLMLSGGVNTPSQAYDSGDIVPVSLEWVDATLIRATVNVYSKTAGLWDLVVTNPDGQSFTLANAVTINHIVATMLRSASISVIDAGVRLQYELLAREPNEVVRLYRSQEADGGWQVIADNLEPQQYENYEFVDTSVEPGRTYYYLLESQIDGETQRELHRGSVTVPARDMVLEQNQPNPFNPSTSIRFYLPAQGPVELNVYDIRGALVRRLAQGAFGAGSHSVAWDGTDDYGRPVASGVYVYRLTADRRSQTRKMLLVK